MRTILFSMLMASCVLFVSGCATTAPRSFSRTRAPSWATIEVRDTLEYDRAWDTVIELLVTNFDLASVLREDGYVRTDWLYTWSGAYSSHYRVRVAVKFSPDRRELRFRPEAQFLAGKNWRIGTDARLVSTIKTDLMGTVGRTTR